MLKHRFLAIGLGLSLATAISSLGHHAAQGIELSGGRTAFIQPPQFVDAFTTNDHVMRRHATYFFTLDLPANADEPLSRVVIAPQNLTHVLRDYRLDDTLAFEGTPHQAGDTLSLGNVVMDNDTKAVTVEFDPPVEPGRLVTIGLRPQRNPRMDAIYVFRITALPPGDKPQAHIAGHGRLHFIRNDNNRIF